MDQMKQQFIDGISSSSNSDGGFNKPGKQGEQNALAMAKNVAILRLLKRNHRLKSALQKKIETDQKPAPVQVDPYMLKELFDQFKAEEAESNGGQAPPIQQQVLLKQEFFNQIAAGDIAKDNESVSAISVQQPESGRARRTSNFSVYLRQKLSVAVGDNTESDLDLNFDVESGIGALSRRDKTYSFANASESDITNQPD